ncbi:MAG: M6 family metalloprotease [Actinobacteria bacterium]|jgi:hypothetical protein|nr:M6 family metalloprotease [Actinomycetota bacterium]
MKRVAFVTAALFCFATLGLTPAYAVDERVIDIVSVSWDGAAALPSGVKDLEILVNTEVNASWKSFTTLNGDTRDRAISFVAGKVLTEPIMLNSKMACVGPASSIFINSIRNEAYKRLGIADDSNRYLIITAPKAGCVWSGRAPLGNAKSTSGSLVLHDTHESFVIAHELGHTFGLGHTNFLRCSDGKKDGVWSDTCKAVEYGGVIDVMGNVSTNSPLNTYHQWRMGLLDTSQVKQVWQTQTLTLAPSDFANGLRAIYVRDGSAAYWVEYRRTLNGVGYKPGLVIFRIDPPPISSVVSANPEDANANEFKDTIGTDLWMLNLDSYRYLNANISGGSMTALSATTYSGNVTFTAAASETSATVTVTKKADVTPPPVPVLIPLSEWRYPGVEILKPGYADADTTIASFEVSLDGVVSELPGQERENWSPGYLNPFTAPLTVYARNLPEGAYSFAIRSIDIAGNKSEWSQAIKVNIDRGRPVVTSDFNLTAINGDQLSLAWTGAKDDGSGLCKTNLVDKDGLIVQSSTAKAAPTVKVKSGTVLKATAQIFDCIGNGVTGDLSITNTVVPADKSSRTGKWSSAGAPYGSGALKCTGKCTASLSASGRFDVLVGTGAASVSIGTKTLANIPDSKAAKLRIGATVDIGSGKKVVRISGNNFVLIALTSVLATFTDVTDVDRLPSVSDPSLTDTKQVALAKFGFNADDFSQEWSVLPMSGGTTLVDPSLDLCNGTFPSEKERVERRQVIATKPDSAFTFLSTETVRYSSSAAAQGAQRELLKVMNQCMIEKGYTDSSAAVVPYTFTQIKSLPAGLVADSSRVLVRAQIDSGVRARQLLGFYQFNGAMFTGLYVMTAGETPFTEAQVETWLNVAVTMATRLSGKSG